MVALNTRRVMIGVTLIMLLGTTGDGSLAQADITVGNEAGGGVRVSAQDSIVVIGASYAKGWRLAEMGGRRLINKGVSGEQTHEMLARFQEDVVALGPKVVIIWGFINDIFRSSREALPAKLEQSRRNLMEMVILSRKNGIEPILATEVTITTPDTWSERIATLLGGLTGKESYQEYINKNVREMNEWLRSLASEEGVAVLDFERVLSGENGSRRREYAVADGSHISPVGYEALTGYARNWGGWTTSSGAGGS